MPSSFTTWFSFCFPSQWLASMVLAPHGPCRLTVCEHWYMRRASSAGQRAKGVGGGCRPAYLCYPLFDSTRARA